MLPNSIRQFNHEDNNDHDDVYQLGDSYHAISLGRDGNRNKNRDMTAKNTSQNRDLGSNSKANSVVRLPSIYETNQE